ncbi:MAG: RecX family transcriptional regulator [Oscillospiraceae bacterium]|nr:RecX family transcriptional regulator [Oscillospiraceae bacterium]
MELSNDLSKAKSHALKFLSFRDHSGGELIKKLGKYYDKKTCLDALSWVRDAGYQSDRKYAEEYAVMLIKTKHYGVRKAKWEMKLKGLSEEITEAALEGFDSREITKIIIGIIEKKYTPFLDDDKGLRKITDALIRRGYEYDDIKSAIASVCEERYE